MRIEAKAPTRIDLAGGTLDIWPLYLFHENAVTVNCAISLYASCVVETRKGSAIELVSRDTHRREQFPSLAALERARRYRLPLVAQIVRIFKPRTGLRITTNSEAPAGAGISGSSALAVALCAALDKLTDARMNRVEWIHLARDAEAMVLGVPTGTQDHYPAAFGGVSAIHLRLGCEEREALAVNPAEIERRVILCYTGVPRNSGINNWEVFKAHLEGNARVQKNLAEIAAVAREVRTALLARKWEEVGRLVREEWSFRRRNLPTISTPLIDRILAAARKNGAHGGKACGAGGGGCVAILTEPGARARVERAVRGNGGKVLPFQIDRKGVVVQRFQG